MAEEPTELPRIGKRRARQLRRARELSVEQTEEVRAAQDALAAALRSGDARRLAEAAAELDVVNAARLAHVRKGKLQEYAESIGIAILFALVLRAFVIEAFQIPTGSMEPTLLVGDHLFVSKFAYGVRVPFTTRYLWQWGDVDRGDIVVFVFPVEEVQTQVDIGIVTAHLERYARDNGGYPASLDDVPSLRADARDDAWGRPFEYEATGQSYELRSAGPDGELRNADDLTNRNSAFVNGVDICLDRDSLAVGKDYIKRVIGLPGDRIRLEDNTVHVNDVPIARTGAHALDATVRGRPVIEATERMDNDAEYTTWSFGDAPQFEEIVVRDDHVFVMGDNRDNSSDGRCWGQVPIENVKGSAMFIFFSRDRVRGGIRWSRIFDGVH